MNNVYKSINSRLDDINFTRIVDGFDRCSFAIFDDEKAILDGEIMDKPSQFVANSVANYNDSLVATFYHEFLPKKLDKATSLIVHEMYHAFQYSKMDYKMLLINHSEKEGVFYEYTVEAITLKYNEIMCLINAYSSGNEEDYRLFLSVRNLRQLKYPKELMYEKATEFIEGFATYVELKALEQLDENLYIKEVTETIDSLRNIEFYFSIRELSYKVGALMLLTLDKLKIEFDNVIQGKSFISDFYSYDYIEPKIERIVEIEEFVTNKLMERKASIDLFFSKVYCKIEFDEVIVYNPMGLIRYENKLLVKFLVIIKVDGEERTLNGYFCLVFDDNNECIELYKLKDVEK
ncbi:MAG: hypothetical protein JEZ08_12845 [Clostridiales bacterium]|nr:hypothetical protein [Clostridiales bacterium]